MPGPSPVPCTFPDDFVQVALDTVRRRTVPVQVVQRFRLVLLLHQQPDMKNDKAAKRWVVRSASAAVAKSLGGRRFLHRGPTRTRAQAHFFPLWIKR